MTDEQIKEINELIKDCYWKHSVQDAGVCGRALLPCEKVIDSGKCSTIIDYITNLKKKQKDQV